MRMTVHEIAGYVGGTVAGDADLMVTGLASLDDAGDSDLSFMRDARYAKQLNDSGAGVVLVPENFAANGRTLIQVPSPDAAFARMLAILEAEIRIHPSGFDERAVISASAQIGEGCAASAGAYVEGDAVLGAGVILYPGVYVGRGVRIGANTVVFPNAVLREYITVGRDCIIHSGAVLGGDGFGFVVVAGTRHKIPQVGTVEIGDGVEIGSNSTVDRATVGVTRIGTGTKIDNLVQIGHNVVIGEHCAISGNCAIAGSVTIGDRVTMGGQCGVAGHIHIGDDCVVGGGSGVTNSIAPGSVVQGLPAIDQNVNKRVWLSFRRIPEMLKRIRQIERRLDNKENDPTDG